MPRRRGIRGFALFVAPSFVALAAVLVAIWTGYSPRRLWPVAGFLAAWAVSGGYASVAAVALRRRTARLRGAPVPRRVRLTTPLWIHLDTLLTTVGVSSILGTVAAALGFPGVGVGVLLVAAGAAFSMRTTLLGTSGLAFEDGGLRVYLGSAACLVPWTSIREVETIGPDHFQMVQLKIDGVGGICDSVSPNTPRNRKRAERLFGSAPLQGGELLLGTWTAGLDGQTLARAIREGMAGRPDRTN